MLDTIATATASSPPKKFFLSHLKRSSGDVPTKFTATKSSKISKKCPNRYMKKPYNLKILVDLPRF